MSNSTPVNRKELIIALLKEVLYNSIAQAIIKIAQTPHKTLKVFLLVSVCASTGVCSFLVIKTLLAYFSYGVNTTSRTIFEEPTEFPMVTICNQSPFTTDYSLEFLQSVNSQVSPQASLFSIDQMSNLSLSSRMLLKSQVFTRAITTMNSKTFSDLTRQKLGHSLNDTLLSCTFNNQACSVADFSWKFDELLGNCYVFNSDSHATKHSHFSGPMYGLQLMMYVNFYEYLTAFNTALGLVFSIGNNSYSSEIHGGVFVSPGEATNIAIDRKFNFILPDPYSNCHVDTNTPYSFDSDLFDLIAHSSYEYTQQLCIEQCFQKMCIEKCNCTTPYVKSLFTGSDTCQNASSDCSLNVYFNIFLLDNYVERVCLPWCPLECNKTEYAARVSSSQLVADTFVDFIRERTNLARDFVFKPLNVDTARNSLVYVSIYYDSLSYTLSTETPQMDVYSLLANIGGTLGLFMGVSVFSVCELVQVLIEVYFICRMKIAPFVKS